MVRVGGADALYSTVHNLQRWNEALFNGEVLSEASLQTAFTPVTLNDGKIANAKGGDTATAGSFQGNDYET